MATATELSVNTAASALDMAEAIFGSGIQVVTATYSGSTVSSGIYTGASTTLAGISPTDHGVILSTGNLADFTNASGTSNTNTFSGTSTNTTGGVDGDAQLTAIAGVNTFDGAILQAEFIPDGEFLTMRFVFTSEEYPEYVNGGVNDAFGVWVNGSFVPATITTKGEIAIDTVNGTSNRNLYIDNTADQYNTEMDGFTRVLTIKAHVNPGEVNSIKIGIADGGDAIYDSNLLIMGDSIQTIALAFDDQITLAPNSSRSFDILANDIDQTESGLTITHINGTAVAAGQTVTLQTGEQVRLNADGTVTVFSDADTGKSNLTYTVVDGDGNVDDGFISIITKTGTALDGIVQGSAGSDLIDFAYQGDPDGDKIDHNDATGAGGTTGEADYVLAGAGNDSIVAGAGNDKIFAGADNDSVYGGAGNDWADLGSGNDLFGTNGTDSAGSDTVYGDAGHDAILGGADNDLLYGGSGNDTLSGGSGADVVYGGADADQFEVNDDHGTELIDGGETGLDRDTIDFGTSLTSAGVTVTFTGAEAGSYVFAATPTALPQASGDFTAIEAIDGTGYADTIDGSLNSAAMTVTAGAGNDIVTGGSGNDTLTGDAGADSLSGGDNADLLYGGTGDVIDGGEGGTDSDTLVASGVYSVAFDPDNSENGTLTFIDNSTLTFSHIEKLLLNGGNPDGIIWGTGGADSIDVGYVDANGDIVDGNDALLPAAGPNDDLVYAGGGADTITAGLGNDQIFGGADNDSIAGGTGADVLKGEAGDDSLHGDDGADSLYGGAGNDTIRGGADADFVSGGDDRDVIFGGLGDSVDGGESGDDHDVLDLTAFGHPATTIHYDADNHENGTVDFLDGTGAVTGSMAFQNIESVIACFTPGSLILTDKGEVPVQDLEPGDMILTRDSGFQELRWIGRRDLSALALAAQPRFIPVRIGRGALGLNLPDRDMLVSPQHRILITGPRAELLFGEHEVLVAATHLVGLPGIEHVVPAGVSYIHLLFDAHEILCADGAWSESFQPAVRTLEGLESAQRDEVLALFPELATNPASFAAARQTLKAHEARVLLRL